MQEIKEEWRDIVGYENYQVSNLGRLKSLKYGKERILKPQKDKYKYSIVSLCKQGKVKTYKVHRLVAQAFIDNPNNLPQVNHKDEDKTNNASSNLEFCDAKYNSNYGTRNQRAAEKTSKQVLCVETGEIYPSTHQIERELGFSQGNISSACTGERKTCGGYRWRYIE